MTTETSTKEELNYFRLMLIQFLRSDFPELLTNEEFIESRTDEAETTYADVIRSGGDHMTASAEANRVLLGNMGFSKFSAIFEVLTEEFTNELEEDEYHPFAVAMMPICEEVFKRYELTEDFSYAPEYKLLYTELTGAIQIYIEEHGENWKDCIE